MQVEVTLQVTQQLYVPLRLSEHIVELASQPHLGRNILQAKRRYCNGFSKITGNSQNLHESIEKEAIAFSGIKPEYWYQYVDDKFVIGYMERLNISTTCNTYIKRAILDLQ